MVPTGVRMTSPTESGMECVTANGSIANGPTRTGSRSYTASVAGSSCSRSRERTKPMVSGVP